MYLYTLNFEINLMHIEIMRIIRLIQILYIVYATG